VPLVKRSETAQMIVASVSPMKKVRIDDERTGA
jgi:hypothetical protein